MSEALSVVVLVEMSLEDVSFEASIHEVEQDILIGWRSGVLNETLTESELR